MPVLENPELNKQLEDGKVLVYALIDPETGRVGYIGSTGSPRARYKKHRQPDWETPSPRRNWIQAIKEKGMDPIMIRLEWTGVGQNGRSKAVQERESKWIRGFNEMGVELANVLDPGRGGGYLCLQ